MVTLLFGIWNGNDRSDKTVRRYMKSYKKVHTGYGYYIE
jgi:hypothetical protein